LVKGKSVDYATVEPSEVGTNFVLKCSEVPSELANSWSNSLSTADIRVELINGAMLWHRANASVIVQH
jgi:hypothetical protein